MTFAKNNRFAIALFVGLALLSLCSWAYLNNAGETPQNTTAALAPEKNGAAREGQQPTAASSNLPDTTAPGADMTAVEQSDDGASASGAAAGDNPTAESPAQGTPAVKYFVLYAEDKKYAPVWRENSSLYDLMQLMTTDSRAPFLFFAREYSGMGYFVEEINGVRNNPQSGEYWIYYVNGQSATVGASQYIVKKDDIITWKYINI